MEMVVMNKKILTILTLFVVSSFVDCEDKKLEDKKLSDYFAFNLVWPNSYCNSKNIHCKEPIPQEFKVESLMSYKSNKLQRHSYVGSPFYGDEVNYWNFSSSLALFWPDLGRRWGIDNERLWTFQWNFLGIGTGMTPENYFYLAVKYAKIYRNIYRDFLHSGVVIPSNHTYQRDVLHSAIAEVLGASPMIKCNICESKKQFVSLRICINNNGVAFDCPDMFYKCGRSRDHVLFPTKEMISSSRRLEDTVQSPIFK